MRYVAFFLLLALPIHAATQADVRSDIERLKAEVKALVVLRDSMAKGLPVPDGDGRSSGLLKITAAKAVAGGDLVIHVLRKDGAWTQAWAVAPDWNPHRYRIEVKRIEWSGPKVEAALTVRLVPWTDRHILRTHTASPFVQPFGTFLWPWGPADAPVARDGIPIPALCRLNLEASPKGFSGTLLFDEPSVAPLTAGPIACEAKWIPADRPVFAPFPKQDELEVTIFGSAVRATDHARWAYEQIRAMELQKQTGLPVSEGVARVTRAQLTWPEPTAKAEKGKGKEPPRKPKSDVPDLDEALGETGAGDVGAAAGPSQSANSAECDRTLVALGALHRHVSNLTAMAKSALDPQQPAVVPIQRGDVDPGDPFFGPFDFCVPISKNASKENVLPEHGGGAQAWPCLDVWKVIGPFPSPDVESWTYAMPDLVPESGSLLVVEKDRFPWKHVSGHQYWGDGSSVWRTLEVNPVDGVLTPPIYTKKDYPYWGIDYGAFYATTVLVAPSAGDVWAGMRFKDRAMLWVNDRPVWTSADGDDDVTRPERLCRFRMPLRKGPNRLMVRCDGNQRPLWFSMRVNVAGKPCAAAEAKEAERKIAAQMAKLVSPRAGTWGLRGDGSGQFPDSDPPLVWDLDTKANVKWVAEIGEGTSGVLVSGDRALATAQPYDLVCMDAATGAVRWRRHVDPTEATDPAVYAKVKPLVEALDAMGPADAAKRDEQIKAINQTYREAKGVRMSYDLSAGYSGMMVPTPVTDGKHVWVKSGSTGLACFDLDGNRKWLIAVDHVGGAMGADVSSPILAFGKLFVQVARYGKTDAKPMGNDDEEAEGAVEGHFVDHRSGRRYALSAYDPETGKRLWITEGFETSHWGNRYDADGLSSPTPLRLGDGDSLLDVVLMPSSGTILRADDGKVLLAKCGALSSYPMPIADERGTLYFVGEEMRAVRMVPRGRDRVEAMTTYASSLPRRVGALGGFTRTGDLLWAHCGDYLLGCEMSSGRLVASLGEIFRRESSEAYMPPAFAGGALYVADTGRNGWNKFHSWNNGQLPPEQRVAMIPGVMSVVAPGRTPLVLARNAMWGVTSSPLAVGSRLYVRSHRGLYCLERTGADGARYEGQRVIKSLLAQIPPAPAAGEAEPVKAKAASKLPYEWRNVDLDAGMLLVGWSIVGPVPGASEEAAAKELGFPAAPNFLGKRGNVNLGAAGRELAVRGIARRNLFEYPPNLMVDPMNEGPAYDLSLVHRMEGAKGPEPESVSFWAALLNVERAMAMRVELSGAPDGTRFWIGGEELKHGQRVYLDRGNYPFAMRMKIGDGRGLVPFKPALWPAVSPEAESRARKAVLDAARPWLKKAIEAAAGTAEAKAAEETLKERR